MIMDILEAKNLVIKAGLELLDAGLIVRTWGNISCRISNTQFVITPSGKAYDILTPDDIVVVNISDLSYEGNVKPSSEKGIHASCYELRPDVNFVIHTHQKNASAVSCLGLDVTDIDGDEAEVLGNSVPCAAYGLPGQPKLREGVVGAIKRSTSKAAIMKHHGAVCMGESYEEAKKVALALEDACEKFIVKRARKISARDIENFNGVADYINSVFTSYEKYTKATEFKICNSNRKGNVIYIAEEGKEAAIFNAKTGEWVGGADMPAGAALHLDIYKARKDVNCIRHTKNPFVLTMSRKGKTMLPLLDDFAQLCGTMVNCGTFNPNSTLFSSKKVVAALGTNNAVLLKDNGALCVAGNEYDADAVCMVLEKDCQTTVGAQLYDKIKPISQVDATLMRVIYKMKYSKQSGK